MSQPVQHHYLPKSAYLKFFESAEKADFVWMYQRSQKPICVNIDNVAKERHLYSFTEESGSYNTQLESALAEMEQVASVVMNKLNKTSGPITITVQEKVDFAYFLAMQVARTPAFRDSLKKQSAEFAKLHMQMLASNKEALAHALSEIKKDKPDNPDLSVEEMQEFIFGEKYTVEMTGEGYFLKQAIELGNAIYPAIMMKDMFVLKSNSEDIITSDYPLTLIPHSATPSFYEGGFLMSGVLIPIGSHTVLLCKNPDNPKNPPSKDEKILVGYKEISAVHARWINKVTISHAERFLFSPVSNEKIKDIFDKTSSPKRFHMSSPFSKDKE